MTRWDQDAPGNSIKTTETPATAEIDVQDPLPESNFFWRRVYSYLATFSIWGLLTYVVHKMADAESLRWAVTCLSLLLWFTITYYMIAPSAEQITRIIQAARTLRSGVDMTRRARVERNGRVTEAETHAGRPHEDTEDAAPRSRRYD
jgi:hypothetical protein